jgi:ATP-dependent Lhr-like helicase
VLREAAAAEGLVGGFSYVYDVYRAMEEQGRVRRGYFVAGRGATQFALPGAEERLRAPRREPSPGDVVLLAATDPANPYGSLLPWPHESQGTRSRSAQRTPGARVILVDGRLLAWLSRGGGHLVTFLSDEEPKASQDASCLARALVDVSARDRRPILIAAIDGVPALESPLRTILATHGFGARQGGLVRILSSSGSAGTVARDRLPDVAVVGSGPDA